jgi:hypothetical protein
MVSKKIYIGVIAALVICLAIQLFFPGEAHGPHHWFHDWWFEAVYGFFGCIGIVFISKAIGKAFLWHTTYSLPLFDTDVGSGVEEARVHKWCVGEGEKVAAGQTVLEVETPRGEVVPIKAPAPGTVTRTFFDKGETVQVHETLINLEVSDTSMKQINERLEAANA